MNGTEWLVCTNPWEMLEFLEPRASARKLLLFGAACCRRAWHLSTDSRHREAVDATERFADGLLTASEFAGALQPVVELWANLPRNSKGTWEPFHWMTGATRHLDGRGAPKYAASFAARGVACLAGEEGGPSWLAAQQAEETFQCSLVRDIFGYPFRPFQFDSAWLSGDARTAVELARTIEEQGRFADIPMLADALERAGCNDKAVLDHCRVPSTHVRGCWVLDALLGCDSAVCNGLTTETDWRTCQDPEPLLHFLRDKGNERKWRLFAVACCRRIDRFITDERSRRAVEVAARYAEGAATTAELEEARATAQEAQDEAHLAEWRAEADANFSMTPQYASACRHWFAAQAARSAVCRDPRSTDAESGTFDAEYWRPSNEWAVVALSRTVYMEMGDEPGGWQGEKVREAVKIVEQAEQRTHCEILRDLFGEYFGAPGDEGAWLPRREVTPECWCVLPSPVVLESKSQWVTWNGGSIPKLARAIYKEEAFERLPILTDSLEAAGCTESVILNHLRGPGPHVRGCWVLDLLMGCGPPR